MSMVRTMISITLFMVLLNAMAVGFNSSVPGNVVSTGSISEYQKKFITSEENAQINLTTENAVGFILDPSRAVDNLNALVSVFFGGQSIANLLHLPPVVAGWINIVQGVIYTITLFLFFSGRAD